MNTVKKKRASITNVADYANVSIATVSRVLNKAPNILPATEKKVMLALKMLDYTPNAQAQSLRGSCQDIFGFLLSPDIIKVDDFSLMLTVQHLLAEVIFEKGYHLIPEKLEINSETGELIVPRILKQQRCCGCFLLGYMPPKNLKSLALEGIPVGLLGEVDVMPDNFFSIDFDFESGMSQAVQYLSALGHRRIGFINGSLNYPGNRKKLNGLKQGLSEFALDCDPELFFQLDDEQNFAGARKATAVLLELKSPPSAICYGNDWMALGGMLEAESRGLNIPRDLSLIGFDNSFMAQQCRPSLTSISTDFRIMADMAANALIKKVHNVKSKNVDNKKTLIPTKLIRRESCRVRSFMTIPHNTLLNNNLK